MRGSMGARPPAAPATAPVATVLTPDERARVDAAGEGLYRTIHRESVDDVLRELRRRPISAVVVSVECCGVREASRLGIVVREFPRVPTVALHSGLEGRSAGAVLALGRNGVRALVDVRQPDGWRELRQMLVTAHGDRVQREALAALALDLAGAPADCWRFFEAIFAPDVRHPTVRALARRLDILSSTLMSRFHRAALPTPKRYLAMARLVRAARAFENPGLSVAAVANQLDYSSPQGFGRHVRLLVQLSAGEFRRRYDGDGMLQRFRDELVLPYLPTLRRFSPLGGTRPMRAPGPAPIPAALAVLPPARAGMRPPAGARRDP